MESAFIGLLLSGEVFLRDWELAYQRHLKSTTIPTFRLILCMYDDMSVVFDFLRFYNFFTKNSIYKNYKTLQ